MALTRRTRLECFYCCRKSAQKRYPGIERWQCEKCDAVNHLDENGEITDPPSASTVRTERYVDPIPRPSSPLFDASAGSPFCATCIKNQHLYNESLASYLPSEDTPEYKDYLKAYPEYKRGLEERYPQVCAKCEPGALAWLRNTNYAAKADNLRRIMDNTRPRQLSYPSDWKRMVVWLGGLTWLASWMGQICWDVAGLMSSEPGLEDVVDGDYGKAMLAAMRYLENGIWLSKLSWETPGLMDSIQWYALVLGILSLWWNPTLQSHLKFNRSRVIGKADFYTLQATSFVIRFAAGAYITSPNTRPEPRAVNALHYCILFSGALFTFISFKKIRIDYNPRVLYQDSTPERLISENSRPAESYIIEAKSEIPKAFAINDLAPQSQPPMPMSTLHRPLTPPTEDDGDVSMDWTPTYSLPPARVYRQANFNSQIVQPNPFHGHLPPDIVSPAHRLRNPPNQPTFRSASARASVLKNQPVRTNPRNRSIRDDASEISEAPSLGMDDLSPMKFADPRFFPESDRREETGLENLFSNTFSIAEEPVEIRTAQRDKAQKHSRPYRYSMILVWILPLFLVMCLAAGYKLQPWQNAMKKPWLRKFLAFEH